MPGKSGDERVAGTSRSFDDPEDRLLNLAKSKPRGISNEEILTEMSEMGSAECVKLINKLLTQGRLIMTKQESTNKILFKHQEAKEINSVKGADNEEKVVYSIVEAAGNKGIWIRDIRFQSNLLPTQLNKILKALENKKLIKAVKSVSASKKKVYMLFNLEPDKSLTGGAWYNDQDFEAEFVVVLSQMCFRFLQEKQVKAKETGRGPRETRNLSFASSEEVWEYISATGLSKVSLSVDDIETILDTILYDGKVEKSIEVDMTRRYRAIEPLLPAPGIVRIPCGVCPVSQFCSEIGSVTPKKCEYLREWLE